MNFEKFTIKSQEAIQQAQTLATTLQHGTLDTGHLLKGIFEADQDVTTYIFQKAEINKNTLLAVLDRIVNGYPKVTGAQLHLSNQAQQSLVKAEQTA